MRTISSESCSPDSTKATPAVAAKPRYIDHMAWRRTSASRATRNADVSAAAAAPARGPLRNSTRATAARDRTIGERSAARARVERELRVGFHSPESPGGLVARDRVDRGYSYGPGPVGDCRQQGSVVCAGGQEANAIHRHRPDRVARVAQMGGQQRLAGRQPGASDRECRPGGDPPVGGAEPPPQGSVSQRTLALKG